MLTLRVSLFHTGLGINGTRQKMSMKVWLALLAALTLLRSAPGATAGTRTPLLHGTA